MLVRCPGWPLHVACTKACRCQGHEPGVYMASLRRPSLSSFDPNVCPDGDNGVVRLAGCTAAACRLEVLHQDHWGSVCDDKFSDVNARVVCASLGYCLASLRCSGSLYS